MLKFANASKTIAEFAMLNLQRRNEKNCHTVGSVISCLLDPFYLFHENEAS